MKAVVYGHAAANRRRRAHSGLIRLAGPSATHGGIAGGYGALEPDADGPALALVLGMPDGFADGDATNRLGIPANDSAKISTKITNTAMTQGAASVSRPGGNAPR